MHISEGDLKGLTRESSVCVSVWFWNGVKGWFLEVDKYNIIGTRQVEVSLHITRFISPLMGRRGYFGFWASCKTITVKGKLVNIGVLFHTQSSAHHPVDVTEQQIISYYYYMAYWGDYSPHSINNVVLVRENINNSLMYFTMVTATGWTMSYSAIGEEDKSCPGSYLSFLFCSK